MPRLPFVFLALLLTAAVSARAQTVTVRLPADTAPTAPAVIVSAVAEKDVSLAEVRVLARATRRALRDVVLRGAFDPAITGRDSAPVQAVALEVGKEGETVGKAKLSWRLDDYDSAVDIILKGPINQAAGVPITDRGLASGASVTLGYNLTLWGSSVSPAIDSAVQSRIQPTGAAPSSLSPLEALIATGLAVESEPSTRGYSDNTLLALNQDNTRKAFENRDYRQIAYSLRESGVARLNRTVSLRGSYGTGSTTFKFAELGDPIVERSETKNDTSLALGVAYVQLLSDGATEAPLMLISGGYARNRAWKGNRARQICTPLGVASASECRSLTLGAPTKQTVESLEIDIRSWAYTQKLGINPHFSYDKLTEKWTSEVGLSYLVLQASEEGLPRLDTKALTVGIRVGSRPEEEGGVYASVFFGTVLSR